MSKSKNIIDYYMLVNKLKYKVRNGWIEYDRPKYEDDEIFKDLIEKIKEYK